MAALRRSTAGSAASNWPWAWGGVLAGVLLGTLVFAPARWLAQSLHALSDGHLTLVDAQGTLWAGSAELVLTAGAGSRDRMRLPKRVQWQLQAGWGRLGLQLDVACCAEKPFELQLKPGWSGLTIELAANRSHWPAQLLTGLGTPWNTLALDGRLSLTHPALRLDLRRDQLALADGSDLTLDATDLSSRLSTLRPMGSYRLVLRGGGAPVLDLSTVSGSLRLSGQGSVSGSHFRFTGEATAAPSQAAELANLLNIIGRRDGQRSVITLAL